MEVPYSTKTCNGRVNIKKKMGKRALDQIGRVLPLQSPNQYLCMYGYTQLQLTMTEAGSDVCSYMVGWEKPLSQQFLTCYI